MMLDALAGLLRSSRYLARSRAELDALRVLPELSDGLPAVCGPSGAPQIATAVAGPMRAVVAELIPGLVAAGQAQSWAPKGALDDDPAVVALAGFIEQGAALSPGAAVVPILEFIRQIVGIQAESPLMAFHAFGSPPDALARIAGAVQARISAACVRAARAQRVPALAWALANSPLLPLYGRGTLDRDPAWTRTAALLGIPLPEGTCEAVAVALRLLVLGVATRRAAGRSTPDDAGILLRHLTPARLGVGTEAATKELLGDPEALAAILPALARFMDAKALVGAGVDASRAARLVTVETGIATASALIELIGEMRSWDVMSQLVVAVVDAPALALWVPRAEAAPVLVVAVRFGRAQTLLAQTLLAQTPPAESPPAAAWLGRVRERPGALVADGGAVTLAVFADPLEGLRFALDLVEQVDGAAVGIGYGALVGGTDGAATRVCGPAVEAATRWVAHSPAVDRTARSGCSALAVEAGWLSGAGVGIATAAADAIREIQFNRGLLTAADGARANEARAVRSLQVVRVFGMGADVVVVAGIPGVTGGHEILRMPPAAWRALAGGVDAEDADPPTEPPGTPTEPPGRSTPASAAPEESGADDPGGWEMAEGDDAPWEAPMHLDLEEAGPVVAGNRSEPRFDFDPDPVGDASGQGDDFSGFYLPGDTTRPDTARPDTAPAPRPAPSFEMDVEDGDVQEEEDPFAAFLSGPAAAFRPAPAPVRVPPPESFAAAPPRPPPSPPKAPPTPARAAPRASDPFAAAPADDPLASDPLAPDPFAAAPSADPFAPDPFAVAPEAQGPATVEAAAPAAPAGKPGRRRRGEPATTAARPPRRSVRADPVETLPVDAPPEPARPVDSTIDFAFLLKGYACFFERAEAVFGRPYGTRIVDRHAYPYAGDPDDAYTAFLQDKIQEGFVPKADLIGDLPRGVTLMPLDIEKLRDAWRAIT